MHPDPVPATGGRASVALSSVFLSPTRAFQEIARGASWLPPFLVCLALSLVSAFLAKPLTEAIARASVERMPEASREAASNAVGIQTTFQVALAPAQTAIAFLLGGLVFTGILRGMGMKLGFKRVFTALCYAGLIPALSGLVYGVMSRQKAAAGDVTGMEDIPRLGLDLLGGEGMVRGLLGAVNPFTIWWLVVLVFGFAVLSGRTPRQAATPVLVAGGIWTLLGGLFFGLALAFGSR
jgi:hypothetical protein